MGKKGGGEDQTKGTTDKIKDKLKRALDPHAVDDDEADKAGDKAPPSEAWSGASTMGGTDEEVVGRERPGVMGKDGNEQGRGEPSEREES